MTANKYRPKGDILARLDLNMPYLSLVLCSKAWYHCREILAHSSFCHPHVVLFREVFLTQTHLGIALEYVSGGDLYAYVR